MNRHSDADPAAMMNAHPACTADGIEQCIQDRPVGNRIAAVLHLFGLAIRRCDRTAIKMIAADDDRRFHLSACDEVVEDFSHLRPFAIPEPANARRQVPEISPAFCAFSIHRHERLCSPGMFPVLPGPSGKYLPDHRRAPPSGTDLYRRRTADEYIPVRIPGYRMHSSIRSPTLHRGCCCRNQM